MLATPILLASILSLAVASLSFARSVETVADADAAAAQKRVVEWHQCFAPIAKDVVHITKWVKDLPDDDDQLHTRSELTHMLDARDLQADMITQDIRMKARDITAQAPLYLGLTGEKDDEGHDILGLVGKADDAPEFQFLICPKSAFMNYSAYATNELDVVYGHLTLASNPKVCVQPSALRKRNAAVVLKPCPEGEDSKQLLAYFKYTEYKRLSNGVTTILRYMEFLGKPNRVIPNQFEGDYTIRFDEDSDSLSIDRRAPNEKNGKGEKSVFSFNNRRKAK